MSPILDQLKRRRKMLGFKQQDLGERLGMSRQQYQRLEARGNPRLDTLELVAKGLKGELMFIPQEKLRQVREILEDRGGPYGGTGVGESTPPDDPWAGLLGDAE